MNGSGSDKKTIVTNINCTQPLIKMLPLQIDLSTYFWSRRGCGTIRVVSDSETEGLDLDEFDLPKEGGPQILAPLLERSRCLPSLQWWMKLSTLLTPLTLRQLLYQVLSNCNINWRRSKSSLKCLTTFRMLWENWWVYNKSNRQVVVFPFRFPKYNKRICFITFAARSSLVLGIWGTYQDPCRLGTQ